MYLFGGDTWHRCGAEAVARKCGIITKMTRREVASQYQVPETQVPLDDENIEVRPLPAACCSSSGARNPNPSPLE